MRLFGVEITRTAKPLAAPVPSTWDYGRGWWPVVREPFAGAWQRNIVDHQFAGTFFADFACKTLIARDIAKIGVKLVQQDSNGLWVDVQNPAYSPVLRKPNHYQTHNQFWESWLLSKLSTGNTYVLKGRDQRGVVTDLYVLNPRAIKPLVTEEGDVYYQLNHQDNLTGVDGGETVPAAEIIHDRFNCLFHPLCGLPPLFASGLAAMGGLNMQMHSSKLYANGAQPGGILTAPGVITQQTADRLKEQWEKNYGGKNFGRVAVLGDGLKYEQMSLTAVEGQMIEQLKWTGEVVCSTYHVPPYKIGIAPMPANNNVQALNLEYYSQCLQSLIEDAETCMDEGLGLGTQLGVEFDIDNLLRMDTQTQVLAEREAVAGGIKAPNEARRRFNLAPVTGGGSPYLQQQNFSLEALAKRDAQDDPFAPAKAATPEPPPADTPPPDAAKAFARQIRLEFFDAMRAA